MKKLVIVESPSKAKKIQSYLGSEWHVLASMGHVRDLPPKALGVEVEAGFTPTYEPAKGKGKVITAIRAAAKEASALYLATDPDREGEAIAWHILETIRSAMRNKPVYRVTFTEITKKAVQVAFAKPRPLDMDLVNSQQARRVLDRLVGWKVSPVLRNAFGTSLSAGRVQSVAVRLVAEREEEIEEFTTEQYWTLEALFARQTPEQERFTAQLAALLAPADKELDPKRLPTERVHAIADELQAKDLRWNVRSVETKERLRRPPPPFITSTLQQKASATLKLSPKRAMQVAQKLYEMGRITYMRTDSPFVAAEAQQAARSVIESVFGKGALPASPPFYRAKGNAQEAHECIRPTDPALLPKNSKLAGEEAALYRLIWMRFIASQMKPALYDVTIATIEPSRRNQALPYQFQARGSILRDAGWLAIYGVQPGAADEKEENEEETAQVLPPLHDGEGVTLRELEPKEHWTQPPPRYTEPSLIKALEKEGVGRPSTYASIMETIQQRGYVEIQGKSLVPTDAGRAVTRYLIQQFPDLLDVGFTRQMEDDLDRVAEGAVGWTALLGDFYSPLEARITAARNVKAVSLAEPCPMCGTRMEERYSRFGRYEVCPLCGHKPGGPKTTDKGCPKCGQALVERRSKRGPFLGCSGYPACDYTENTGGKGEKNGSRKALDAESAGVIGLPCPECAKPLVERQGRFGPFAGCSGYPDCRYIFKPTSAPTAAPAKPRRRKAAAKGEAASQPAATEIEVATVSLAGAGEPCPKCGKVMVVKQGRYGPFVACPGYPACKYIHKAT